MTIQLGLTGSIGMGKSTTAGFFKEFGVPVWDADATVHEIYSTGGAAVEVIGALAPSATKQGFVDRSTLKSLIAQDKTLLGKIETAISPILATSRSDFLEKNKAAPLVLFDIPLLFETDAETWLDYVVVVTAPEEVQRARVLARKTMSDSVFETILARQMPDAEKRALADFVFDTSHGMDHTKQDVKTLIDKLEQEDA